MLICLTAFSNAAVADENVELKYTLDMPIEQIGPDEDVVKLTLHVQRVGQPLNARLHVVLDSPPRNSLISTDFPIVEGTRLIDTVAVTQNGELKIDYLFPIRGRYTLTIDATAVDANNEIANETFHFTLRENPNEVRNFVFLVVGLVLFGLISGGVLARGQVRKLQAGSIE